MGKDAIDYVYKNYLPGRTSHIHAPKSVGGSSWPANALQKIPTYFDSVNVHNYDLDISQYTQRVHEWMNGTIHANSPLWVGEWGTYKTGYDEVPFSVNLIKNLIRGSQPGNNYIYGSHIFSLYDWGKEPIFQGLMGAQGKRRVSYYAFRMGIRALQGGRETFLTSNTNPNLMAIATKDDSSNVYLLIANSGEESYKFNADFSTLISTGTGQMWEFSSKVMDEVVGKLTLKDGNVALTIPANAAILIRLKAAV